MRYPRADDYVSNNIVVYNWDIQSAKADYTGSLLQCIGFCREKENKLAVSTNKQLWIARPYGQRLYSVGEEIDISSVVILYPTVAAKTLDMLIEIGKESETKISTSRDSALRDIRTALQGNIIRQ